MAGPFTTNEHGTWCPSCGELLSNRDEDFDEDADCPTCGYPDDIDKVAEYHTGEDDDDD